MDWFAENKTSVLHRITSYNVCYTKLLRNTSDYESLAFSGGHKDVSFKNIVLPGGSKAEDYCLLEMQVTFEESSGAASNTVQETLFSVTPLFIQA